MRRAADLFSRARGKALSFLVRPDGTMQPLARYLSQETRNDILFRHNVAKWFRDEGDSRLRLAYPELGPESVVFDLGGYKGQFASDIHDRYRSRTYVFEPFGAFYEALRARFSSNPRISVYPFGLGAADERHKLFYNDDGTSMFRESNRFELIEIRKFQTFVEYNDVSRIDLLKINIEGSEYDLLESIIGGGLQSRIANIQVQFHRDIPDSYRRMSRIKQALLETHELTYEYQYVWENYRLK